MAGEYVRWLARDVKPQQKQELTPQQKRRNWWEYNKWYVIIGLVVLVLCADLVYDMLHADENRPDYTIAYVGEHVLPGETVTALEERFARLGEDLSGNGQVEVEILEYIVPTDSIRGMGMTMQLTASIEKVESMIYLLDDPEAFHAVYPILEESYPCPDCPALADLALPAYLHIARRGLWNTEPDQWSEGAGALWEILTDGA